eukprot:CAMPEP_0113945304 /NCGR_PEP_ID=MMETSP1339-20121228/43831_1 /TAXON_ID=94617 /ORGANISM="Fibrocapsa japonica" /LENGTH=116 /DNA_ID=CAMNT_0000950819 /DNA_START=95 /DNA_END=446 /DNA_ORIENTATION=+ /assembly_acc=CAM_ASM_000762
MASKAISGASTDPEQTIDLLHQVLEKLVSVEVRLSNIEHILLNNNDSPGVTKSREVVDGGMTPSFDTNADDDEDESMDYGFDFSFHDGENESDGATMPPQNGKNFFFEEEEPDTLY